VTNSIEVEDYPRAFSAQLDDADYSISYQVRQYRDGLTSEEATAILTRRAQEAEKRRRRRF
jgi:hypothetical protein